MSDPAVATPDLDRPITVLVPAALMPDFQRAARDTVHTYASSLTDEIACDEARDCRLRGTDEYPPPLTSYAVAVQLREANALYERTLEWDGEPFEVTASYRVLRELTNNLVTDITEDRVTAAATCLDPSELRAALRDLEPRLELREQVEAAAASG